MDDTQRTIMPNATFLQTKRYSISGVGPSGATLGPLLCAENSLSIDDIAIGAWQMTVKALNAENNELSSGTATLQIHKGVNEGTIVLDTIPGEGSLQLSFVWKSDITLKTSFKICISVEDSKGNVVSRAKTVLTAECGTTMSVNLAAGSHVLTVMAMEEDGSAIAGATEAIRIVSNTRSDGTITLKSPGKESEDSKASLAVSLDNRVGSPMGFYIDYYPKNPVAKQVMTLKSCISDIPDNVDRNTLSYQWYKDGVPQRDGVGCNYIIVTSAGTHRYDVVVRSEVEGTMCSASVLLNIPN